MLSRIPFLEPWLIVLTLLLFAGSAGAEDIRPRCKATLGHAAEDYSECPLRPRKPQAGTFSPNPCLRSLLTDRSPGFS